MPIEVEQEEARKIMNNAYLEVNEKLTQSYRDSVSSDKQSVLDIFDSKIEELKEQRRLEEERKRKEEEARKAEEERKRKEEEARKAEEERKRKEAELKAAKDEEERKQKNDRDAKRTDRKTSGRY